MYDVKSYFSDLIDKDKNVKLLIGNLEHDFLEPLQISLTCLECNTRRSQKIKNLNKKWGSQCLKSHHAAIFKSSDIVQILRETKKRYIGDEELRNVHLFLDEVSHLDQDWASLDKLAEDPTNSIWLSSTRSIITKI